jgi:hypothetical protein
MKTMTALLGALVLSTNAGAQLSLPESIAEGKPFPAVVLPGLADDRPTSIADFRGSKVVLHVFASW